MIYTGPMLGPMHANDLVLVAFLPQPRDLEIARTLGWYRIPIATAPKIIHVDWLAFYLPRSFGEAKWSVRHVAEVRGFELQQRRELLFSEPDHPRAREPYYKLQLGPVLELRPPIPSRSWRRFTFLYTTGERLLHSTDLKALRIPHSAQRSKMLREWAGGRMSA